MEVIYGFRTFPKTDFGLWFASEWSSWILSSSGRVIPLRCLLAAAAAKSLQLCPTLCDPIDGGPPGSPVPGILQARTLEWVAISFSNAWKGKVGHKVVFLKVPSISEMSTQRTHFIHLTGTYWAPTQFWKLLTSECSVINKWDLIPIVISSDTVEFNCKVVMGISCKPNKKHKSRFFF